jgi:hypothetical protein
VTNWSIEYGAVLVNYGQVDTAMHAYVGRTGRDRPFENAHKVELDIGESSRYLEDTVKTVELGLLEAWRIDKNAEFIRKGRGVRNRIDE